MGKRGLKIYQICYWLVNLPIELKPSLAPPVPQCISFCNPDWKGGEFIGYWVFRTTFVELNGCSNSHSLRDKNNGETGRKFEDDNDGNSDHYASKWPNRHQLQCRISCQFSNIYASGTRYFLSQREVIDVYLDWLRLLTRKLSDQRWANKEVLQLQILWWKQWIRGGTAIS